MMTINRSLQIFFNHKWSPKMVLTKITCQTNANYKALTYNYRHTFYMSGRYFTLEELKNQSKLKGKIIEEFTKNDEINKPISKEESTKLLKLMKQNEYNMVEQVRISLAQISILSLILSLELQNKRHLKNNLIRYMYLKTCHQILYSIQWREFKQLIIYYSLKMKWILIGQGTTSPCILP